MASVRFTVPAVLTPVYPAHDVPLHCISDRYIYIRVSTHPGCVHCKETCSTGVTGTLSVRFVLQAQQFQRKGRELRNKMWWQNCRMKLAVLLAIIILAVVIFCLVCFSGGNCLKKK